MGVSVGLGAVTATPTTLISKFLETANSVRSRTRKESDMQNIQVTRFDLIPWKIVHYRGELFKGHVALQGGWKCLTMNQLADVVIIKLFRLCGEKEVSQLLTSFNHLLSSTTIFLSFYFTLSWKNGVDLLIPIILLFHCFQSGTFSSPHGYQLTTNETT